MLWLSSKSNLHSDAIPTMTLEMEALTFSLSLVHSPVRSMDEERAKANFNIRELTYLLDGGEKSTSLKERFMAELERDPLFKMDDFHDLTKSELRERTMEKVQWN